MFIYSLSFHSVALPFSSFGWWPAFSALTTGLIERFIETKTALIISRTSKAIYICNFEHPLVGHSKIVLVCPPLGELEPGFEIWIPKVNNLSKELSLNVHCYCNSTSKEAIVDFFHHRKQKSGFTFSNEFELTDLQKMKNHVGSDDLIIYVAARRTSVSYDNCMENIQEKLEKNFPDHSKIIIYPRTHHIDSKFSEYGDIIRINTSDGLRFFFL